MKHSTADSVSWRIFKNPVALFVPCHRVIAADGTLWGYGGGLAMKQWLLRHEHAAFTPLAAQESLALELTDRTRPS